MRYRLGIDVGGTNTDAVIMDENRRVVAKAKTAVTDDVITGITRVVSQVVQESGVDPAQITHAMLGTTQVTNAIIERRGLLPVGILRLGSPATHAIRPLAAWPEDLRRVVEGPTAILPGGVEYDGRPISEFDEEAVRRFAEKAVEAGIRAFAVTSVFSPVRNDDERRAAEIIAAVAGDDVTISLSYEIGSVGLLERENATVLNAAVSEVAKRVARAFADALAGLGIRAELFLSQNDGTLMSLDYALRYPILTVACGPTNSIRGAGFLSGREDAVVIDVGGTSTDVGVLVGGFPRESAVAVEIGGVRTNFRMPDLISIGLGGGSIVRWQEGGAGGGLRIGPDSVGSKVVERALCFGGDVLTMTDVAVARGMADLGDRSLIRVPDAVIEQAHRRAVAMVEEAVDRIKTRAGDVPAILVGGGSILLPDRLEGVSVVERPPHYEVANAVGAAIAQVSGTVDRIFSLENRTREQVLEEAKEAACAEAVQAGADPDTVGVIEVEEVPLAYLPGNAVRIKVKAAGQLRNA
ncbi:MAG: hydantoinase subunit beta [Bacillota bacterium]|nr:MAG: hydantoinase subunit beta [Bacillota bacterium]